MKNRAHLLLFLLLPCFCVSQLSLTNLKCGEQRCKYGEFCSEIDRSCKSCARICDVSHHNYEEKKCMENCADYILDTRYMRKDEQSSFGANNENNTDIITLSAAVHRLSSMVTVTLSLVILLILVLCTLLGFQAYRWKIKKNITWNNLKAKLFSKPDSSDTKMTNQTTPQKSTNGKPDLRLDIPNSAIVTDHSPITAMTSISRRPAEDSAVGYAYDNHAMSSSPSQRSSPSAKF